MSFIVTPSTGGGGTPGGADTQIQYNNAGAFAGSANMVYDNALSLTKLNALRGTSATFTISATGTLALSGVAGSSGSSGAAVNMLGGSVSGSGSGGNIQIRPGNSSGTGAAGTLTILGGSNTSTGAAGSVSLTGGSSNGSLSGGSVTIAPGDAYFEVTPLATVKILSAGFFSPTAGVTVGGLDSDVRIGFYDVTPIARPTTSVAAATFVAGAGVAVQDVSTFDGYTLAQIAKALRNLGLLT